MFEDYVAKEIPPPEGLLPPELIDGYGEWYQAFWELTTERSFFEGGCGPIPLSAMLSYPGITENEMAFFCRLIRAMDKRWLAEYAKETEAAASGKPRKKHPRKVLTL